ncbi:3-isopropylmalate dehydratase [Paracandidimonas lactea]|uniref:LeuD/DmdB family oxidoreductase small subunit n=1 Tax=Paracandidimonas lactea TaxID=2895524 RepID=UPI001F1A32B2|nr:3-isopropylmalate dehydratase [Paracandidimonas lactea]
MTTHRVWRVGESIDTDALAPGAYMKFDVDQIARHCLEGRHPGLAQQIAPGDVLVAGPDFGIGSSREQAVGVLVALGVRAVVAPSFSGLYFRNAFNLGLLAIVCPDADQIEQGERVQIDTAESVIRVYAGDAQTPRLILDCEHLPPFLVEMAASGGLLAQLRQSLAARRV